MLTDADALARAMYERNVSTLTDDPAMVEEMWKEEDVRAFWLAEAEYALQFIADQGE